MPLRHWLAEIINKSPYKNIAIGPPDIWKVSKAYQEVPLNYREKNTEADNFISEEHHVGNFDPGAFFALHDYDASGAWTADDVLRTYGLEDESQKDTPKEKRDEVVNEIMKLMDKDHDGQITHEEWMQFNKDGGKLPDFGVGH